MRVCVRIFRMHRTSLNGLITIFPNSIRETNN